MMDKVKVSKELKEVLDDAIIKFTKEEILKIQSRECKWRTHAFKKLNVLTSVEMAEILIIGYEVEETPEEKILKYYEHSVDMAGRSAGDFYKRYWEGVSEGILKTLDFKSEKIKGINSLEESNT